MNSTNFVIQLRTLTIQCYFQVRLTTKNYIIRSTSINKLYLLIILEIKENPNCMEVVIITWHLKHYDSIDVFLENGLTANSQNHVFNNVFQCFRKTSIKWSVKKCLIDLIAAKSHQVALVILDDLRR